MKQLREESIAQVQHALADVLQEADGAFADRAETLVAIAEHFRVSITEMLLPWIHVRTPDKQWSGIEWRAWCERYAEARSDLARRWCEQYAEARAELARRYLEEYAGGVK